MMVTMPRRSPRVYDTIVVGVGGMGSAACYHLARRGLRTLGLERFDIPHTMGSSHGITRIIRMAYYEDPSYVPLLLRACELWDDLERESERRLLEVTGTIPTGGRTWGIAVIPNGRKLYAANGLSNDVTVIDTDTGRVISTIRTGQGSWGVAVR